MAKLGNSVINALNIGKKALAEVVSHIVVVGRSSIVRGATLQYLYTCDNPEYILNR
jgi:hypothetical protein